MGTKPNIIFFFTDQQRWDTVGCYGQPLPITPNIDKMALEGVKFEYAFTCQPVCGPARSCIQSGKYATETGCFKNNIALPPDQKTIAHYFNEAGYETAYVGKWHLASSEDHNYRTKPVPPERRGGYRDYWMVSDVLEHTSHGFGGFVFDKDMNKVEFTGYRADCITDFALEYLDKKTSDKPFFLFISHIEPHHQNDIDKCQGPEGSKEMFGDFEVPCDLQGTEGNWMENYPDYLGSCARLDRNLGRIADKLEELGIKDNTVIFYTSDHGCHFKTRNERYKSTCHESSIRIPLVVSGPGFRGGKTVDNLVSLIDIPPTLLACAGIEIPGYMRGRPLQQLVNGDAGDWPEEVFIQITEKHVGRAIRRRKWKYAVTAPERHNNKHGGSDVYIETHLYDLENDPGEKRNLVNKPEFKGVREILRHKLVEYIVDSGEPEPEIIPQKELNF